MLYSTHIQILLQEIHVILAEEKSRREVAEYYGFRNPFVVKRGLSGDKPSKC